MSASLAQFSDLPKDIRFEPCAVTVDPAHVAAYQAVVGLELGAVPRPTIPPSYLYSIYLSQPGFRERYLAYGIDAAHAIHASQRFEYHRPIEPGETLTLQSWVKKIIAKPGAPNFIVSEETEARSADGELVFVAGGNFAFRAGKGGDENLSAPGKPYTDESTFTPIVVPAIAQERLNAFAEASLDHNPIHLDPAAARAQGFETPVVHGMLVMAFMGEACAAWCPGARFERFTIRFLAATPVHDTLELVGSVRREGDDESPTILDVAAVGPDRCVRASAEVRLRR